MGFLGVYLTGGPKRSVTTSHLRIITLNARHWQGIKEHGHREVGRIIDIYIQKKTKKSRGFSMADTVDTVCVKFPVKRPRSRCTCVTQRRAEFKNNSPEKSFIKNEGFLHDSSSLRLGRLQASWRGGSISDKQRLHCCGARPLRTVPFEPLRCVRNECLKK